MHKLRFVSLLLIIALLVSGLASAQDETILVVGHAESTDSLDPARGYTQTVGIINHVTYETLVTFPTENASEIRPLLASDWEISEDGLTYTFTLNGDAVFHNGDDLTADDVVFSVNRLKNVNGSPSFLADNIASVEAVDDDTVRFTLAEANPAFLVNLANNAFGVVHADLVRAEGGVDGEDAETADAAEGFLNGVSVGTGPYILESWEPQVETVLVRNANYWGEQPYFDRIIITNIPEAATQKVALESGEIDIALDLTSDQIATLEGNADITIASTPGNITHFILMNENPDCGPTADENVQRAVRAALDYDGYVALWGGITPASMLAFGIQGAYGPDMAGGRDLEAAAAALAEAGYADGLDLTLSYPVFSFQGVDMETNAQKIQADLAEAGINVTLEPGELQVSLEQYRTGQQCFGYWFWGPDILDPIDLLSFLPGGKVASERALWMTEDAPEELVALIEQAGVESDPDARVEVFGQLQDYLISSGPFAPFIQPNVQTAFRTGLEGYVWHPQWLIDLAKLSRAE